MKKILSLILALGLCLGLCTPAAVVCAAEAAPIRIAVIDTGISSKLIPEENLLEGKNYILPKEDTEDKEGHGTAVASFIVGTKDGRVKGTCPSAMLVPLTYRSVNETGHTVLGFGEMVARAVYDAVDLYHCQVINISSIMYGDVPELREAVAYAHEKGAIVVASAGNWSGTQLTYPGAYDTVLCVGACEMDGTLASYSQHHEKVDLLARGTKLPVLKLDGTYASYGQGTSFVAPMVSGIAARLWMQEPDLTADEVCQRLLDSCLMIDGWRVLDPAVTLGMDVGEAALDIASAPAVGPTGFLDVPAGAYYTEAVDWAVGQGIASGTGADKFSPDLTCTTAQILTFLWRANGSPAPTIANPFADVAADAYYSDAAVWAYEKGLVSGPAFDGDAPCTRSATVTYLWKLAGEPSAAAVFFTDVDADAGYAQAVSWAVQEGITAGTGSTTFSPDTICSRGQIVTFLYRDLADKT